MNRNPLPLSPLLALLFLCSLLAASPGFAQGEDEEEADDGFARSGWYLVGSAIGAFPNYRDIPGSVDNTVGGDARVGYRTTPRLAMEAEFEFIPHFDETLNGAEIAGYRSYAVGLNGKFYLFEEAIQPYVIVGVNVLIVSESIPGNKTRNSDWGFRGGLGLDYYITQHIALNAEAAYMWGVGDVWQRDYTAVSAGLMYRF